jgi:hypothetical protein
VSRPKTQGQQHPTFKELPESTSQYGSDNIIHGKQVTDNKNPKFNPYQHQQQSHKPSIGKFPSKASKQQIPAQAQA